MSQEDKATLNIGALSTATDVPVETIRTWERRYGFPESRRNEAGHRIYDVETIEYLRLIREVLSQGYRPSQLKGRSRRQLQELLEKSRPDDAGDEAEDDESTGPWLEKWIASVKSLDRQRFVDQLRRSYHRMAALAFLQRRLVPFLEELGQGWRQGRCRVVHEHFATETVRDFLTDQWRPMSRSSGRPPVVVATFPGERHGLSLHMLALIAAMAGRPIIHLGTDTPVEEIAAATTDSSADVVLTSISECTDSATAVSLLSKLRDSIDSEVDIIAGGRAVVEEVEGIEWLDDFDALDRRLEK